MTHVRTGASLGTTATAAPALLRPRERAARRGAGSAVAASCERAALLAGAARAPCQRADRAEVTDLVGVDDGADGPNRAAHDVEGDDRDDEAVEIADDGARLAVDPGRLEAEVQAPVLVGEGAEQMHHAVAPVDRLGQRR